MRSRRYSTISWFSIGIGSMTRRPRASRVTTGRTAFWDHGPRSVVRYRPRGFSSGRHRPIELFPTASKTTSYWWSSFVKSTASRSMTRSAPSPRTSSTCAAVQLLADLGARVTAVCGAAHVELVRGLGADRVIDRDAVDFTKDDHQYDVVFDAVGKSSIGRCRPLLKPRG